VHTVAARDDRRNREFKEQVQEALDRPVYFCGRLANYTYINQDQAIEQAFACAESVLAAFGER
jgi:UDP-galactopyranose mutase